MDNDSIPRQSFVRLARQRKFDEIMMILQTEGVKVETWLEAATLGGKRSRHIMNGESALHVLVMYRPPISVVDLLSRWFTTHKSGFVPEDAVDAQGQTPLHIAVTRGCDVAVIERLTNVPSSVLPATTMDYWRRCPLHWACCMQVPPPEDESRVGSRGRSVPSKEFAENMVSVVQLLIKAYPLAAVIEDTDQKTPLDLAVENRLDKRILLALLKAAGENSFSKSPPAAIGGSKTSSYPSTEDEMSLYAIPREVDHSVCSIASDFSSIGAGGVSYYRPNARM
jgi:ankyrin repeat protein